MKTEFVDLFHTENDKNISFEHNCVLGIKTTDDDGNITKKKEQGYMIQGRDCIYLNAPKIYPSNDTPLLTDAPDIVGAINELFQCGSGGGDVFQVSGSRSGITVTTVKNRGEAQELSVEFFTFKTKEFKTLTTVTSGNTTVSKIWSKTVITEVLKNGATVWEFSLDSKGNAIAVLDSAGNDVLNGITGADGNSVITPTPEGIALGWALAYNDEQDSALKKALDAYQDGIDDCDEINQKEGVGSGDGDGNGDGDSTGGDDTGDGTGGSGGVKLPEKKFDKIDMPELPNGSGAGAVNVLPNTDGSRQVRYSGRIEITQNQIGSYNVKYLDGVIFEMYNSKGVLISTSKRNTFTVSGIDEEALNRWKFYGDVTYDF